MPLFIRRWAEYVRHERVCCLAILFLPLLGAEAFAQSTTFQYAGPLAHEHLNNSATPASVQHGVTAIPLLPYRGTSTKPAQMWTYLRSYRAPANSRASVSFGYSSFGQGSACSGALKPFQIASCIGLIGLGSSALNRVQNVVVHIMRHYDWQEAVRVNRDCARSLSCSSLYEKSAIRRIALRPPK